MGRAEDYDQHYPLGADPMRACHGKTRFLTWQEAARAARWKNRYRAEVNRDRAPKAPYQCPHCAGYHIGGAIRPPRKRLREIGGVVEDWEVSEILDRTPCRGLDSGALPATIGRHPPPK